MADYTVQEVSVSGVIPTFSAVALSDTFANDGNTILQIDNAGASSVDVTIKSAVKCNQGFSHDIVVTVAAATNKIVGPFVPGRFNDPVTNKVTVDYSAITSVTACVLKL